MKCRECRYSEFCLACEDWICKAHPPESDGQHEASTVYAWRFPVVDPDQEACGEAKR